MAAVIGMGWDDVDNVWVPAPRDTSPVLANDGFADLVIVILAGIVIISAAWHWFRNHPS